MILEGEVLRRGAAERGKLGKEGGELDGAVDGEDLGVAADVGELIVVGSGLDLAAVTAHELGLVVLSLLVVPRRRVLEVDLPGARRGVAGVRVGRILVVLHCCVRWKMRKGKREREREREINK